MVRVWSFWFRSISITSLSLCAPLALAAKCYYPDGTPVRSDRSQPCNSKPGIDSMCCSTDTDVVGARDKCLANGLCHNPCTPAGDCANMPGRYWRESCTDASWNSPFCLKGICAKNQRNETLRSDVPMSLCALDGQWCCGDLTSEECCAMKTRIYLAPKIGASSSISRILSKSTSSIEDQEADTQFISVVESTFTSSSIPALTSTSISTSTSTSTLTSPSTSTSTPPTSHSQTGKSAGIGAGTGAGILAIGILVLWLFVTRQRRRRRRRTDDEKQYQRPAVQEHATTYPRIPRNEPTGTHAGQLGTGTETGTRLATSEMDGANIHEIDGVNAYEIDGMNRSEMDGRRSHGRLSSYIRP